MRTLLSIPFFVLAFLSLAGTAVVNALAILFNQVPEGSGSGMVWIIVAVLAVAGFGVATFFYWIGESIRVGRVVTSKDIFVKDDEDGSPF